MHVHTGIRHDHRLGGLGDHAHHETQSTTVGTSLSRFSSPTVAHVIFPLQKINLCHSSFTVLNQYIYRYARYLIQDMVSMNPESSALLKMVAHESTGKAAGAT